MLSRVRINFRDLSDGEEVSPGHIYPVRLPQASKLQSIYSKAHDLTPGASGGSPYRVRIFASEPASSCWQLELKADSLSEDARTADTIHQGLNLHLPETYWVTYQLLDATFVSSAILQVEMLVEM